MNQKIVVLGDGYIGSKIAEAFKCTVTSHRITSFTDCQAVIAACKPRILINCVGYTGARNVDDCELKKDETLLANSFVPIMLAEACLRQGVRLVHISSGCMYEYDYSKQRPISETRVPDYYNLFYTRSKVYAERCLEYLDRRYPILTVRIRIPLDNRPLPKNILSKLIRYRKVIDVANSVTYVPDFIKALRHLIAIKATGIYNVVNKGTLRYPSLMEVYRKRVPSFTYTVLPLRRLGLERTNLILSTRKLERSGFHVRHIRDVLEECVGEYVNNSIAASHSRESGNPIRA
jgi:dTDP-4-dehydrorhamnose reductase